jgi:Ni/Co efflux regulator RcnB
MKRLAIITLAATALVPAAALAQHSTVSPPVKWEDVPDARLRVQGSPDRVHNQAPAHHAAPHARTRVEVRRHHAPAAGVRQHVEVRHAPGGAPMMHNPVVQGHHGARAEVRHGNRMVHRRGDHVIRRDHHGINRYPHYRRIDRGLVLPHSWWGPRFHIQNWNRYGFSQPMHGNRWVRYYDDALLIDRMGRVHDGRYGMRWDEYGDEWGYDESGTPIYSGNGDYHSGEEDYALEEDRYEERYRGYGHGGGHRQQVYAHPVQPYARYGYGYGYGYGAIITETTVTTAPTVVKETYYVDEVVTQRAHKPRRVKRRPAPTYYRKPAPVRPYGERG